MKFHRLLTILALSCPSGLATAFGSPAAQDALDTQTFSLPDARATRALSDSISGHIGARRWSEAIHELQLLLDDHRGDVLAAERPKNAVGRASQQAVHPGAAQRARARLWALPLEARRLYRERHETEARAAFERARAHGDRQALAEVARRWPLTESAQRAWWALGDLELEIGDAREALFAWERAIACALEVDSISLTTPSDWDGAKARLSKMEPAPLHGVEARVAFALNAITASDGSTALSQASDARGSSSAVSGRAARRGPPPGRDADAWPAPFVLPEHPFKRSDSSLYPVRAGDTLLVSTSLRLLALNAYSGALLWDSGEPDGWENLDERERADLLEGVDWESGMVAPAASDHVALCALHVPRPVARREERSFQSIKILTPIPERRLYAFDLNSGRELWNHRPPPLWDGESGSFTDRMSVAGPPVIVGTRVVAPFRRMQGRVDYHVACMDVDTGALLWSTDLISGQRELNMFGRPVREFSAPPLVVVGDRVIALTQLGAIAALDLFTGEILWETIYDQIPLPKAHDFNAPKREWCWRNAAPVVVGDTVIAAPVDSRDLIGVDLATGRLAWSLPNSAINNLGRGRSVDIDLLLGAEGDVVYLSGTQVLALTARGGIADSAPNTPKWAFEDDVLRNAGSVRGLLGLDRIVIPSSSQRIEIELSQGLKIADWPWPEGQGGGNLLLGAGELFTVSRTQVNGYFEWDVLVDRARRELEHRPDDPRLALALGELLSSRGIAQSQKGRSESARSVLSQARSVLERALANDPAGLATPLGAALHVTLRAEARVKADLADASGALRALREARASAPDRSALRDTLLDEIALLEARQNAHEPLAAAEALMELERSCADLPIACAVSPPGEPSTAGETLLPRFTPVTPGTAETSSVRCEMPIGLWVLFERTALAQDAGAVGSQFADLHRAIERYGDVPLPDGSAASVASERIGSLLRAGLDTGYDVFEKRAQELLDAALQTRDRDKLSDVTRLYPHSRASHTANDAMLAWAVEALDVERVARIVESELPSDWRPSQANDREVRLCLHLASVMAGVGNRELANEMIRTLADHHPALVPDPAGAPTARLEDLASHIVRWTPPALLPPPGYFDANSRNRAVGESWGVEHEILGVLPSERPASERALLLARFDGATQTATFVALTPADPLTPRWTATVKMSNMQSGSASGAFLRRTALSATRVLVATGESIQAFDSETGAIAWTWRPPSPLRFSSLQAASGVVLAVLRLDDDHYALQALDAHQGHELWREELDDPGLVRTPVLSSNQVIFLPQNDRPRRPCVTLDLFTGRRGLSFQLDFTAGVNMERDAWVEEDRLILPCFNATKARLPQSNHVTAIDLVSGERLWRVTFSDPDDEPRTLDGVLQFGERTFLVLKPWPADDRQSAPGTIVELATKIGATAPISNVRLMPEDRILGMPTSARVRLSTSLAFVLSGRPGADDARVRCIDLTSGELWPYSLGVPAAELEYNTWMPLPAISDTTVAIGFTRRPRERQGVATTCLVFLDRHSGLRRDERTLSIPLNRYDRLQLVSFGDSLLVKGGRSLEILR